MTLILDRIDAAPIQRNNFPFEFNQWLAVLVDTLNEIINDVESGILSTTSVIGTTQPVDVNSLYIPTNVALTTFQLPNLALPGERVTIAGQGTGGWRLLTGVGQTIQIRDVGAVANASVTSSNQYDSIEIICVVQNTTWITLSTQTTGFVIV